jgi:putative GTP pyrophosphokinase
LVNRYIDNFLFASALKIVETNIEVFRAEKEASLPEIDWPIKRTTFRIKSEESFLKKCQRKGIDPMDKESVTSTINDIAGFRIVVPFLHNISEVVGYLKRHSGFVLYEERDYVEKKKESGYRGVHLIMGVAVATSNGTKMVTVEFQVRTTAMDEWCSKEHAMNYKNDMADQELIEWFKERAEEVWQADLKYEEYYQKLKAS